MKSPSSELHQLCSLALKTFHKEKDNPNVEIILLHTGGLEELFFIFWWNKKFWGKSREMCICYRLHTAVNTASVCLIRLPKHRATKSYHMVPSSWTCFSFCQGECKATMKQTLNPSGQGPALEQNNWEIHLFLEWKGLSVHWCQMWTSPARIS